MDLLERSTEDLAEPRNDDVESRRTVPSVAPKALALAAEAVELDTEGHQVRVAFLAPWDDPRAVTVRGAEDVSRWLDDPRPEEVGP